MEMTGGQIIADHLIREGVRYVFGVPGHGNTAMLDAFVDRKTDITVLPAMHEQGAAHMADGYHRVSGQIAVACTSIGPGATNTLTGVATAYADSMPLLLLTGGAHTYMAGRGVLQELDRPHADNFPRMAEPVVKRWWQPSRLDQLPRILTQAFAVMLEGRRGPVLLNMPQDLQADTIDDQRLVIAPHRELPRPAGDESAIDAASRLLSTAKRPLILAGGGVIASGASDDLAELAEYLGAPVTVSFMGKGAMPEDHELFAWPCGDLGSIPGNAIAQNADVILAVGCRFSDRLASSYMPGVTFNIPPTKLIQIDLDGFEIGKNYPAEVGIVGDAQAVLQQLREALKASAFRVDYRQSPYFAELQSLKRQWEERLEPMRNSDHIPVTVSRVLTEARRVLSRDTIVVTDSSNPQNQVYNEFPVYGPKTHITAGGFSGIGFSIPAAIGAKLAAPDTPVVAIMGDGSFLQTGSELAVAAMLDLPVVILVLNNGGWEAIKNLQDSYFGSGRELITRFRKVSGEPYFAHLADFARSLGCNAERVEQPAQIGSALQRAQNSDRPSVVEVMTAQDLPWSGMHVTGWWDITVPAYLGAKREAYQRGRGF